MEYVCEYEKFISDFFPADRNVDWKNTFLYSQNNGGKTRFLMCFVNKILQENLKKCMDRKNNECCPILYIPVYRLGSDEVEEVSNVHQYQIREIDANFFDVEMKQNKEKINYNNYYLRFRNFVLNDSDLKKQISDEVNNIFGFEDYTLENYSSSSDGVKNVINILSAVLVMKKNYGALISFKNKFTILIDEIELYLHPNAQIKLINFLHKLDNTICIFTSHSPFLIQRIKNINVVFIENNKYKISKKDYYFQSMDSIFEQYFKMGRYPDDFKDLLSYLERWIDKPESFNLSLYKSQVKNLREKYKNLNLVLNNILLDFIETMSKNGDFKRKYIKKC